MAASAALVSSLAVALPAAVGAAEPPALMTGLITDAATGQPVPGACMELEHPTFLTLVAKACAGADGRYTIPGKAASPVNVRTHVYADGYGDRWLTKVSRYESVAMPLKVGTTTVRDVALSRASGTLHGTLRFPDGTPVGLIAVWVYPEAAGSLMIAATRTAPDGTWSVPNLPPGAYRLAVSSGVLESTGPFTVTDGGSTTADVTYPGSVLVWRTLHGTVRDTGAQPVAGARVSLWFPGYGEVGSVNTDAAGGYSFPKVASGLLYEHRIVVTAPGRAATWSGDRPHPQSSPPFQQLGTSDLFDFTLRPSAATVSGRLTDGTGDPVVTTVQLRQSNGSLHSEYSAPDGTYRFPNVWPDQVTLNYTTTGPKQFAARKLSEAEADKYTVAAGAAVTVDNQLFGPTGTLEVRLVDAVTGELLPKACALMSGNQQCVPGGIQRFEGLLPGPRAVTGQAWPVAANATDSVTVNPDGVTVLTLRLEPLTHAEFRVARDTDGTAPGFCVRLVAVYGTPQPASVQQICNYASGTAPGDGIITTVPAGRYQALVEPQDTTRYGRQWLGADGGTGRRAEAAVLDFRPGKGATAPVIKLDGAGSIRGRIDSVFKTETPRCVRYAPMAVTGYLGCAAPGSEYQLTGLGPYAWELEVSDGEAAAVWSGGAPDRSKATGVVVTAGQTTRFDHTLKVDDSRIKLLVADPSARVTVYSAVTGDELGTTQGSSMLTGLPAGRVYLHYDGSVDCWYGQRTTATPDRAQRVGGALNLPVAVAVGLDIKPGVNCFAARPQLWNPADRFRFSVDVQGQVATAVAAAVDTLSPRTAQRSGRAAS
ncbi:carboxypeptidase-like regulatory domain-containing protein [Catellatospora sp. IY07-71]|uniref:carboxypeptidase-like regulatory domain-containing protein n=1 Tax=Catellatospora sp. IY07-71 TaxID=2728827 RepID=UPI001BB3990A|nr:carboxypeptidase-like regulatory domain-containing protein [Catellatospora sp. IY07-71]